MVSRDAFEALQQALKQDVIEPQSMAIVSEKEILEARYRNYFLTGNL